MGIREELADIIASRRGATAKTNDTDRLVPDKILERFAVVELPDLGATRVWTYAANVDHGDTVASVSIDVPNRIVSGRSLLDLSKPDALRDIAAALLAAARDAEVKS